MPHPTTRQLMARRLLEKAAMTTMNVIAPIAAWPRLPMTGSARYARAVRAVATPTSAPRIPRSFFMVVMNASPHFFERQRTDRRPLIADEDGLRGQFHRRLEPVLVAVVQLENRFARPHRIPRLGLHH